MALAVCQEVNDRYAGGVEQVLEREKGSIQDQMCSVGRWPRRSTTASRDVGPTQWVTKKSAGNEQGWNKHVAAQ